jgi:hypothetical protein
MALERERSATIYWAGVPRATLHREHTLHPLAHILATEQDVRATGPASTRWMRTELLIAAVPSSDEQPVASVHFLLQPTTKIKQPPIMPAASSRHWQGQWHPRLP